MRINDASKFICVKMTQLKTIIAVTNITRHQIPFWINRFLWPHYQLQSLYIIFCQLDISSIPVIVKHSRCATLIQYRMFLSLHIIFHS